MASHSADLAAWKSVLSGATTLGKKAETVVCNLVAVDLGMKPAFLWDVGVIKGSTENEKAHHLNMVLELALERKLTSHRLRAKQLLGEIFVTRSDTKLEPDFAKVAVIDLRQSGPRMFDGEAEDLKTCPCAVWGVLLGFPVVYFVASSLEGDGLFLAGEQLCVTELVASDLFGKTAEISVTSFSYPSRLEEEVNESCARWIEEMNRRLIGLPGFALRKKFVTVDSGLAL